MHLLNQFIFYQRDHVVIYHVSVHFVQVSVYMPVQFVLLWPSGQMVISGVYFA